MEFPKVSIVIPVYNGDDFLGEAIESALAQTYANTEVLVINDGSNDGGRTERVARSYGERIRYFSKPNGGVASALNLGIEKMSGDYFSWLSHDDLYLPQKVAVEMAALATIAQDRVVIYSDYSVFTDSADAASDVRLSGVHPDHFRYWLTTKNSLHGCTLLIPRVAFEIVGRFNCMLRTTQDYDLWFRMAADFRFFHLPEVLVKARNHVNQGSYKMASVALEECNVLLSNFVRALSISELEEGSGLRVERAYRKVAASMFSRGFLEAGNVAEQCAARCVSHSPEPTEVLEMKMTRRLRNCCYGTARKILPRSVRSGIKAVARPLARRYAKMNTVSGRLQEKFSEVYEKNIFGGRESRSGEGSDLLQTEVIRREIPKVIQANSITSLLDAPCGDWYWMKHTELGVERYFGVDIVERLISKNRREFGSATATFHCMNLVGDDLPQADLILCRDCLVHLAFEDALKIVANFKRSGAKFLLTTTFVQHKQNNELHGVDDFWRPLNLQLPPFGFPNPVSLINEGCTEEEGRYKDKCLGLWRLSDIEVS